MTPLQRLLSSLTANMRPASHARDQERLTIGNAAIVLPSGWILLKTDEELASARSSDGHQRVTMSILRFKAKASFEDFKQLCSRRIEAEKKVLEDGFVEADAPFQNSGSFGMFFFGGDKKVRRTFSGYLFLEKNELITIYVEGVGVAPKEHLLAFQTIVKSLKRR